MLSFQGMRLTVINTVSRRLRGKLALAFVLLIAAAVATRHIGTGEFNFNVDESQHACTGQFVASLLLDHPIEHPVAYSYLYYAHYPALSGVIHWPPFFYLCEGLFFLLFGASVITARLCILAFVVIGLIFWFRLLERLYSKEAAVCATLLLGLSPVVVAYDRIVMLEIPSLALAIVASYFWIRFLLEHRNIFLYWFGLSAALAALTKQNDIYLLLFCLMTLATLKRWRLLYRRAALTTAAIGFLTAAPYYFVLYKMHWATFGGYVLEKQPSIVQGLIFYVRALPALVGWPILLLGIVGLANSFLWAPRANVLIFASWFAAVYLTMTMIGHKEARYVIYLVPALLYFALWPLLWRAVPKWFGRVLMGALMAYLGWSAWQYDRPWVAGYAPVATEIRQNADSGIILLDTDLPANFIFFMRNQDPERRFVVLRKALYSERIEESMGYQIYLHSAIELEQLFRNDGVRFIVVSSRPPSPYPISRILRDVLQTNQFRLLGRFPVKGNSSQWKDYSLLLYENLQVRPPESPTLHIPMLTMSEDIDIPFNELGVEFSTPPSDTPRQ